MWQRLDVGTMSSVWLPWAQRCYSAPGRLPDHISAGQNRSHVGRTDESRNRSGSERTEVHVDTAGECSARLVGASVWRGSVEFIFHGSVLKITINSTNRFQAGQAFWLWKVNLLKTSSAHAWKGSVQHWRVREKHPSPAQFWPSYHQMGFEGAEGRQAQKLFSFLFF